MTLNHITPHIISILFFLNLSNNVLANEIDQNGGQFYYTIDGYDLYYHNENKNFSIYMDRDYSDKQNVYNIKYVSKNNNINYSFQFDPDVGAFSVDSINKLDDICKFSIVSMVIRSRDENSKYLYTIAIFGADKEFVDLFEYVHTSKNEIQFDSYGYLKKIKYKCITAHKK